MKDNKKASVTCIKKNKTNTILKWMHSFDCEGQGHQMYNFKMWKTGVFTCFGTLFRWVNEIKKETSLCIKKNTPVTKSNKKLD